MARALGCVLDQKSFTQGFGIWGAPVTRRSQAKALIAHRAVVLARPLHVDPLAGCQSIF